MIIAGSMPASTPVPTGMPVRSASSPVPGPASVERSGRAAPLSPEDRRAAIVAATVPLLLEHGVDVTTRELAAAAGVAEGTLFRVFPDKRALLRAGVEQALDPGPTVAALDALERTSHLRPVLVRAVDLLLVRSRAVGSLLHLAHQVGEAPHAHGHAHGPGHGHGHAGDRHPAQVLAAALSGLLDSYGDQLRREPAVCARILVALILSATRPIGLSPEVALSAEELVDLFLDGALRDPVAVGMTTTSPRSQEPPC